MNLGGTENLVLPAAFICSLWSLAFLVFGKGIMALFLSWTVGSVGPMCSVGREASWCQKIAKP
jgi:hypothetical protein